MPFKKYKKIILRKGTPFSSWYMAIINLKSSMAIINSPGIIPGSFFYNCFLKEKQTGANRSTEVALAKFFLSHWFQ